MTYLARHVHLGFLELKCVHLRSPGLRRCKCVRGLRSPAFTVEEMQMRSGVLIWNKIGGGISNNVPLEADIYSYNLYIGIS